jgi:DNA-binding NarL/FixJ family response regulator
MTASQPISPERSFEELHIARDQRLRVLVADQDGFARRMLQRILQGVGEVAMTTGARDSREALELAHQYRPGMLLLDIALPPAGGVELIREVLPILPRVRIVTVSAAVDRDQAVLAALRAGAIGHIDKETAPDQIARLVSLAAGGEVIVPGRLMTRLLPRWRIPPQAAGDRGEAP